MSYRIISKIMAKRIAKPAAASMRKPVVEKEPVRFNLNGFKLNEDMIYFNEYIITMAKSVSEYKNCNRGRVSDIMRTLMHKYPDAIEVKVVSSKELSKIAYE